MRVFFCSLFCLYLALFTLSAETAAPAGGQPPSNRRSFDEIFPNISPATRKAVFTGGGYNKSYEKVPPSAIIGSGQSRLDPDIVNTVLVKQPGYLVESILVIPCVEGEYSLLDVYNALGKIRGLKGRLYHSFTRKEEIPLFEEVTRIESEKRNVPIDDPAPAMKIPSAETVYIRLKDVNFGNSFYRGDMTLEQRGLRYSLTNNRNLTYFLVPVIREEKFTAQLYFELISEGILIYGLAGADVSDFVSSKIDMTSAINKRLAVIIAWVSEGITGKKGA